jgi:hypothetical protein
LRQGPDSAAHSRSNYVQKGLQVAEPLDDGPFFHGTIAVLA